MEREYYLGFSAFSGIGPVRLKRLLKTFGTAEAAWNSKKEEISATIGESWGEKFELFRKSHDIAGYAKRLQEKGIGYLCVFEEGYPGLLKKVPSSPFVLYYKGDPKVLQEEKTIGIVGTRKITDYGRKVTKQLTQALMQEGFVIVSGLAFGVDGVAHTTTLEHKGKTIAVLGGGVDICTPLEHRGIYEAIIKGGGCVVSGVVPGERPMKGSFPARNAIIAGLSQGVVVTEGAEDSGALYTAKDAMRLQRPVFAVPGPITSALSKGANKLLSEGAIVTVDSRVILDKLGIIRAQVKIRSSKRKIVRGETNEEQEILDFLENGALHFDELVRKMKKDSAVVGSLLSFMELKGMLTSNADGKYSLIL